MAASRSDPETAWRGFARGFLVTVLGLLVGYLALALALDPYDSGRSPLGTKGLRPQGPRTAAASRGRDPAFSGAIIGNSHIQLIEPERLGGLAGLPFVQLSVPATGPGEQLVLLDWFLRHHPDPRAIVLAPDDLWCTDDPDLPNDKPFPFWLFSADRFAYLRGLLRYAVAQEVVERIGWLLRRNRPYARPDGWWDYEPDYLKLGLGAGGDRAPGWNKLVPAAADPGRGGPFPAADALRAALRRVPPNTAVVAVLPPVAHAVLPRPGTERAEAEAACKAALADALASHPRSALLDWRRDGPEARDPTQFFDTSHYRHPLARRSAEDIAASLRRLLP